MFGERHLRAVRSSGRVRRRMVLRAALPADESAQCEPLHAGLQHILGASVSVAVHGGRAGRAGGRVVWLLRRRWQEEEHAAHVHQPDRVHGPMPHRTDDLGVRIRRRREHGPLHRRHDTGRVPERRHQRGDQQRLQRDREEVPLLRSRRASRLQEEARGLPALVLRRRHLLQRQDDLRVHRQQRQRQIRLLHGRHLLRQASAHISGHRLRDRGRDGARGADRGAQRLPEAQGQEDDDTGLRKQESIIISE